MSYHSCLYNCIYVKINFVSQSKSFLNFSQNRRHPKATGSNEPSETNRRFSQESFQTAYD
jgi:hypothetical protein